VDGKGGVKYRPAVHSTPVPSLHPQPTPSPSASSQFEAWLRCRKEGYPAKLVLETDGVCEEVSLWFRKGNVERTTAEEAAPSRRRRKRPERGRRRKQRREELRRAAQSTAPPTLVGVTAARDIGPVPTAASMVASSPPGGSPPAKRPRTRAAVKAGGRTDPPTPEKSRVEGVANPRALNLTAGEELCAAREEPPDSPPPASPPPMATPPPAIPPPVSPPPPLDVTDTSEVGRGNVSVSDDPTQPASALTSEPDYNEELWENGICLNTRRPPWQGVFPPRGPKFCRFCEGVPMPNQDPDDKDFVCADCNNLSTFQLVVKYAPRWRYYNSKSMFNLYSPPP